MSSPEQSAAKSAQGQTTEGSLLDQIVDKVRLPSEPAARQRGKDIIKEFVSQIVKGDMTFSRDADATINARIAQIDHLISLQLNEVLHHPSFQKLEATWRGIKYLLDQSETSTQLKIRVINASKKEVLKDLQRAPEFDQSNIFKKVYEEEFGVFGGEPFGALIGDYEFGRHPEDVEFLERISQVAGAAHAPFLTAANPELLNLESFTQLGDPRDVGKIFEGNLYAKWRSFRESEDSRYVGLAMPHILMRLPYGKDTKPVEEFAYEEKVDGSNHANYLWGNAAYASRIAVDQRFREIRLVRSDPRRRRWWIGGGLANSYVLDRRGRCRSEVSHRNCHHRPARERARRPRFDSAGALQGIGLCRVL